MELLRVDNVNDHGADTHRGIKVSKNAKNGILFHLTQHMEENNLPLILVFFKFPFAHSCSAFLYVLQVLADLGLFTNFICSTPYTVSGKKRNYAMLFYKQLTWFAFFLDTVQFMTVEYD